MNRNVRSRIYLLVLFLVIFIVWKYRQQNAPVPEMFVQGVTMGTIQYNIKYLDNEKRNFKKAIDSLLVDFNQALSTYVPDSEISRFNRGNEVSFSLPYFPEVLQASQLVYEKSSGAFDPTIGPLIDAWGFGAEDAIDPDSAQIDSLLQYTGFEKIQFDQFKVLKLTEGLRLNFSAIAKGQAIDVVGDFLSEQGINHYMVEIGGEVRAKGKNREDNHWLIAIERPEETVIGEPFDAVYLENQGMATSGNYRNFRFIEGKKVAHTINPKTGFPKMQTLLSATVLAPNCMLADAYATACMVLGLEEAKAMILADPDLEAYFIFSSDSGEMQTYLSPGLGGKTVSHQDSLN